MLLSFLLVSPYGEANRPDLNNRAFKYRGRLFRPTSAIIDDSVKHTQNNNKEAYVIENYELAKSNITGDKRFLGMTDNKLKPSRTFSTKGRLEGHISDNTLSSKLSNKSTVVNLYCDFSCANITKPSTTKVELKKQDIKKHSSSQDSVPPSQKNQTYINNTTLIQPTICGLTAETKYTNIELNIVHANSQNEENHALHTDLNPRTENLCDKKYDITSDICHG